MLQIGPQNGRPWGQEPDEGRDRRAEATYGSGGICESPNGLRSSPALAFVFSACIVITTSDPPHGGN